MLVSESQIKQLADALVNAPAPTAAEIRRAITLAYDIGKNAGALETINKYATVRVAED